MISVFLQFCALHPFLLMVILVGLMLLIFYKTNKNDKTIYWSNLAWLLPAFGVVNFIWGDDWNAAYVFRNGEKGKGVVVRIDPTNTWVNRVREVEYVCLIRTADGKTLNASFVNNDDVFYPKPKIWMPPGVGEAFDVRYMPGNETNFVILTNDRSSVYANKLTCTQLLTKIAEAQTVYTFDPKNKKSKHAYVKLLRQFLKEPCDTNVKKAYTLMLERVESGDF